MSQIIYVFLTIFASFVGYLYLRTQDKGYKKKDSLMFLIGMVFWVIGCFITTVSDKDLFKLLTLKELHLSGKLILAGYAAILIALFLYLEKITSKIFKKN